MNGYALKIRSPSASHFEKHYSFSGQYMKRLKNMVVTALITVLLLIQDWYDWLSYDPLGQFIHRMIFFVLYGIIAYFVCQPLMLRKLEEKQRVRNGEQDEWEPDS